MSSGIFAIATIGKHRLYIGETHQLQARWTKIMTLLVQGNFPSNEIQQAWQASSKERRFTFHTAPEITDDSTIYGYHQFLQDTASDTASDLFHTTD